MTRGDFYASAFGAFYSAYMERPWLARRISRLVWGGDLDPYYASMAAIGEVPEGGVIVDCPCGAGPALRLAPPRPGVRYVAVDLSPSMLSRARSRALDGGLADVELIRAQAADVPLPSMSADLFLSFWGLHCFPDPAAAIAEAARLLALGGRLVGCAFVRGADTFRQRMLIRPGLGDFGQVPTAAEVSAHLARAGLEIDSTERRGPMLYFTAHR
ncbi:MAG: class I SAM-dependent methyltransferase [Thermoleophilaceae bacterium]